MVSGNIRALEDSLGTYGHRNGAGVHFGTGRVPTHMGTGMVLANIWASEWCPDTCAHSKVAWAHMGTGRVLGHIWAPQGYSGTGRVLGHIRAPECCPGT